MSRFTTVLAAAGVLTLAAAPAAAQSQDVPAQRVNCAANLEKLPAEYRAKCEAQLAQSEAGASVTGGLQNAFILVPVGVVAAAGLLVATSHDDKPVSN